MELDLDELGISDHLVLLAGDRRHGMGTLLDNLPAYINALNAASEETRGRLTIRFGVEADFDPLMTRELGDILKSLPLDYVIGSVHFVGDFPIDRSAEDWDVLIQVERDEIMRGYWKNIAGMARSGLFDIAGHMDLYKKFGHHPTIDLSQEISEALDAIAGAGMAVELNTAGWHVPAQEQYPSLEILRGCKMRGIPVLLSADAHLAEFLTRDFDKGEAMLRELGYIEKAAFAKREMKLVAL